MASKYKRSPAKPKQSTTTTKPMENTESKAPEEKTTHEQHKDFVKAAEDSVKPNNEPTLENFDNVTSFDNPTIEREYTSAGFKTGNAGTGNGGTPPPNQPPIGDFEPTPPSPDGDPDYAPPHEPEPDQPNAEGFKIPAGSLEDMVDTGAVALNYLIGKFAGFMVNVKIKPQYHSIRDNKARAIDIIKDFNEKSVEKLKLSHEEIEMLKGPLVKVLQEKGLKGTTPTQDLLIAAGLIVIGKGKDFMEIKHDRNKLQDHFDSMIQYMRNDFKNDTTKEDITPPPADEEQEPIFTHAEEV